MAGPDANLLSALFSSFSLIFLGFLFKRLRLISPEGLLGLGTYLTKCALPALIFSSISGIDFSSVRWLLLLALALGKLAVGLLVIVVTLLLDGSPERLGRAALQALFCIVSNDFAFGLPLLEKLYPSVFTQYLYLIAPVNFFIIVPTAFIMLEISAIRSGKRGSENTHVLRSAVKGTLTNPLVIMTALGLIANFAFHRKPPGWLMSPLVSLGQSFSAVALVLLGTSISGRLHFFKDGKKLSKGLLLTLGKTLLVPCVTAVFVTAFSERHGVVDGAMYDLTLFAFIYGTIPTAPTIFAFASEYNVDKSDFATSLVLCTLLSAPLLFVSAKMAMLSDTGRKGYGKISIQTGLDLGYVSIASCVLLLLMYIIRGRYKTRLDRAVISASLFCLLLCAVSTLCMVSESEQWRAVRYFGLWFSEYGVRLGNTLIVCQIAFQKLHVRRLRWLADKVLIWLGLAIPLILVGMLYLKGPHSGGGIHNGLSECWNDKHVQHEVTIVLPIFLISNLIVQICCIISITRSRRRLEQTPLLIANASIEDVEVTEAPPPVLLRHRAFMYITVFSTGICSIVSTFKASNLEDNGVTVEMGFLDNSTNYLQGVFLICCFGVDQELYQGLQTLCSPAGVALRKLFFDVEVLNLPIDTLAATEDCAAFFSVAEECHAALAATRNYHLRSYDDAIRGDDLVTWLVQKGVCANRDAGISMGKNLINGRVMFHVTREHHFHDFPYFYKFQPDYLQRLQDFAGDAIAEEPPL